MGTLCICAFQLFSFLFHTFTHRILCTSRQTAHSSVCLCRGPSMAHLRPYERPGQEALLQPHSRGEERRPGRDGRAPWDSSGKEAVAGKQRGAPRRAGAASKGQGQRAKAPGRLPGTGLQRGAAGAVQQPVPGILLPSPGAQLAVAGPGSLQGPLGRKTDPGRPGWPRTDAEPHSVVVVCSQGPGPPARQPLSTAFCYGGRLGSTSASGTGFRGLLLSFVPAQRPCPEPLSLG